MAAHTVSKCDRSHNDVQMLRMPASLYVWLLRCFRVFNCDVHRSLQVEGDAALAIEKSLPDVTEINELTRLFHSSILKRCDKLKKRGNLLVITIDALTQLDKFTYRDDIGDVTEAHALQWMLPEARMPDNVRIVLASLKGRPVDVLSRRTYKHLRGRLPLPQNIDTDEGTFE